MPIADNSVRQHRAILNVVRTTSSHIAGVRQGNHTHPQCLWDTLISWSLGIPKVQSNGYSAGAGRYLGRPCQRLRRRVIARDLGADVSGLDASENLAAIARDRLPGASIKIGEMEELPFNDEMFDVITGINSFQFADDIVQALREARRVCRHRGTVAMLVWGRRQDCELLTVVMPAVFALLPPATTNAPPLALAEPGVIEGLMREAGLSALESSELANALAFPDQATAVRAIMSAAARAIRHAGEEAVRRAIAETLARVVRADGSILFKNHFRLVTARRD